jgi:hypothetical protein
VSNESQVISTLPTAGARVTAETHGMRVEVIRDGMRDGTMRDGPFCRANERNAITKQKNP